MIVTTNPWGLAPRECEVLQILASTGEGSSKRVAALMGISHRTVEVYVQRARERMKVATRLQAVLLWDRTYGQRVEFIRPGGVHICPTCRGLGFLRKAA